MFLNNLAVSMRTAFQEAMTLKHVLPDACINIDASCSVNFSILAARFSSTEHTGSLTRLRLALITQIGEAIHLLGAEFQRTVCLDNNRQRPWLQPFPLDGDQHAKQCSCLKKSCLKQACSTFVEAYSSQTALLEVLIRPVADNGNVPLIPRYARELTGSIDLPIRSRNPEVGTK